MRVVVRQADGLHRPRRENRGVPGRALEMPLLVGGPGGVGQGAFKVDDGQVVVQEPGPHEGEGIVRPPGPPVHRREAARAAVAVDRAERAVAGEGQARSRRASGGLAHRRRRRRGSARSAGMPGNAGRQSREICRHRGRQGRPSARRKDGGRRGAGRRRAARQVSRVSAAASPDAPVSQRAWRQRRVCRVAARRSGNSRLRRPASAAWQPVAPPGAWWEPRGPEAVCRGAAKRRRPPRGLSRRRGKQRRVFCVCPCAYSSRCGGLCTRVRNAFSITVATATPTR